MSDNSRSRVVIHIAGDIIPIEWEFVTTLQHYCDRTTFLEYEVLKIGSDDKRGFQWRYFTRQFGTSPYSFKTPASAMAGAERHWRYLLYEALEDKTLKRRTVRQKI